MLCSHWKSHNLFLCLFLFLGMFSKKGLSLLLLLLLMCLLLQEGQVLTLCMYVFCMWNAVSTHGWKALDRFPTMKLRSDEWHGQSLFMAPLHHCKSPSIDVKLKVITSTLSSFSVSHPICCSTTPIISHVTQGNTFVAELEEKKNEIDNYEFVAVILFLGCV